MTQRRNLKDYSIGMDILQIVSESDNIHTSKLINNSGIKNQPSDLIKIYHQRYMKKYACVKKI